MATVAPVLWPVLRDRYVLYGEWLYAKHTAFYDALAHYFCEFDVLDLNTGTFLTTPRRADLLAARRWSACRYSTPDGSTLSELVSLVGHSRCRTPA